MLRAAAGRAFARTFTVTVAAAVLVGAGFGLLFWWFGARGDAAREVVPAVESSRIPVASGAGDLVPVPSAAGPSPADGPPFAEPPLTGAADPPAAASERTSSTGASSAGASSASASLVRGPPPGAASSGASSASASTGYDELYEEAKRARRRRDYTGMLDLAARAVAAQETAQALTMQAEALTALGDPSRALPVAERATQLRPRFSSAWYIKGRILRTLGDKKAARVAFERYLEIDPEGNRADQVLDMLQDM